MASTKTQTAKVTTAGIIYKQPRARRKVQQTKDKTYLPIAEKIQVAALMNKTRLDTATVARMFNICEATALAHAKKYRDVSDLKLSKPKKPGKRGAKAKIVGKTATDLREHLEAGMSATDAAAAIGVDKQTVYSYCKLNDIKLARGRKGGIL